LRAASGKLIHVWGMRGRAEAVEGWSPVCWGGRSGSSCHLPIANRPDLAGRYPDISRFRASDLDPVNTVADNGISNYVHGSHFRSSGHSDLYRKSNWMCAHITSPVRYTFPGNEQ
jgi:hypothetical protein